MYGSSEYIFSIDQLTNMKYLKNMWSSILSDIIPNLCRSTRWVGSSTEIKNINNALEDIDTELNALLNALV